MAKQEKPTGTGGVQIFELTMDNSENQDDLNRRLRKSGESDNTQHAKPEHQIDSSTAKSVDKKSG